MFDDWIGKFSFESPSALHQFGNLNSSYFTLKASRPLWITGIILAHVCAFSWGQDDVLNTLPVDTASEFKFIIPPRPAGHILDSAHFLTEEIFNRLNTTLEKESKDAGVDVLLLVVPSLQKNSLDPFTQKVSEVWTSGLFGAVVVFDDGTGRVSIQQSENVTKRFYEFELSVLLKDSMGSKKRPRPSREGLEHTTLSTMSALHELKMRAETNDRDSKKKRVILATVGIIAVLLGIFEYSRRKSRPELAI